MQPNEHDVGPSVAALIATRPRFDSLLHVALPSVCRQRRRADCLVIVSDHRSFTREEELALRAMVGSMPLHLLVNRLSPGAAGTWNTGLEWLNQQGHCGHVAILDDDDEWDADHLAECVRASNQEADVVISGLRAVRQGVELPRKPLSHITRDDFLAGNPGWQGSNTFVKLSTLMRVGGFWNGLPSTNDRDLAVRLLSLPDLAVAFTGRMTATWNLGAQPDALSRPGSPEKREGLLMFLQRHGHLMNPEIRARFIERARVLFGFDLEASSRTIHG